LILPKSFSKFASKVADTERESQIRKLARVKNTDLYDTFIQDRFQETLESFAKNNKAKLAEVLDFDLEQIASGYSETRFPNFVRTVTNTDVGKIRSIIRKNPDDLQSTLEDHWLMSEQRLEVMGNYESHLLDENLLLNLNKALGYITRSWVCYGDNPCGYCLELEADNQDIPVFNFFNYFFTSMHF